MPRTTLDKMVPGESGRIRRIHGRGAIRRRLVDMGLTSGAVIDMVKTSPLGDPVEYRLRGYHLSLRKSEANTIEVDLIDAPIPSRGWGGFTGSSLPLGRVPAGQIVVVTQTRGGWRLNTRIKKLGLDIGSSVQVIQNEFAGPLIISVNGDRQVVGKGMARHILVKPA
jgi:ferrous iron transport protein A